MTNSISIQIRIHLFGGRKNKRRRGQSNDCNGADAPGSLLRTNKL